MQAYESKRNSCCWRIRRWSRSGRCQLWRLLLLPFVPILALIVQTTLSLKSSIMNGREVADVEEQHAVNLAWVNLKDLSLALAHSLRHILSKHNVLPITHTLRAMQM
ncbi:hypothetical protein EVAR_76771_1 [Eumeta japonica]|uniref:Uncharacterized protein n=1 Tax=Eumeta variegata TaxID=151549 RepID=A0A4C1ST39_EUMVA|nr:hypothetical protein EVAR_76771_1 [Eumeta japonica]